MVAVKFCVCVFQPDSSCQVVSVGVSMMVAVKFCVCVFQPDNSCQVVSGGSA